MAKRKNHTNHNQSRKAHRNGIKRPISHKYRALKGMDPKFLRNMKFAKASNQSGPVQLRIKLSKGADGKGGKEAAKKPAAKPAATKDAPAAKPAASKPAADKAAKPAADKAAKPAADKAAKPAKPAGDKAAAKPKAAAADK